MEQEIVDIEAQNDKRTDHLEAPPALFTKANRPVTLMFHDINYKIKSKKPAGLIPRKTKSEEKMILKGISGAVHPGEMLAMLGPSGSGKTTLLTALGGRLGRGLAGNITYNGKPFSNTMKRNTGFVAQDDILLPHLTVTETLVFTALLRLPNTLSKREKIMHAEAVISRLGLAKCKNSMVGSQKVRGVSGGERKRISIGQEMLINPSLLLLDEPTSGLDSTTAQRIVSTLWELANGGRTIVMTIHQPSSRLFYMFHKIILLSEGNEIYFGKGSEAMDYFSSIGYSPLVAMNPSDYLLDLANGVSTEDPNEDPSMVKQQLVSSFKSNLAEKLKSEIQKVSDRRFQSGSEERNSRRWSTSWWQQFSVLLIRGVKERKHESFSGLTVIQVLLVALLVGFLWWKCDPLDQIGLLFFSSSFWGFFPLFQAIFTFPQERLILRKERTSGMYRLSSYYMSRTIADLPMELVLPTVYIVITYLMAGLKPNAGSFFGILFSQLLSVLVSQGFGLALGALVMDEKSATTLGSVIMLSFVLAGGYYIQKMPSFIAWIKYVSVSQYTYKLFLISQYKATDAYPCPSAGGLCKVRDLPAIKHVGLDGKASAISAMVVMLIGYRLVAYVALMRIGVTEE